MIRLVLFLLAVFAATLGLNWLADRPGTLVLDWQGRVIETSVFRAVVIFAFVVAAVMLAISIIRSIWRGPATIGQLMTRRSERNGLEALSTGLIAIGSGDAQLARKAADQARKHLPNEPLTLLLRAQSAQLQGDSAASRRMYESMLGSRDTEPMGLRGLYLEAQREGEVVAATQFAERALTLNPKLEWPAQALFDLQCKSRDWTGALETLATARKHGHMDKRVADRRRAVLLTAQAQAMEDDHAEKALELAQEAHGLAPDLVPAAAIAGRILSSRGQTPKAAKIIQRTWKIAPHPDLATAYAFARTGDSPSDRLDRMQSLAKLNAMSPEGALALAATAIDAREWVVARTALEPLLESRLTPRVCTLMAKIEGEGAGNAGKVREWLARAVNAPRDPVWTADGVVSNAWAPVSPVTGALDAFEWRVPVEHTDKPEGALLTAKIEELVALGAPSRDAAVVDVIAEPAVQNTKTAAPSAKAPPVRATPVPAVEDAVEVTVPVTAAVQPAAAQPVVSQPAVAKPVVKAPVAAPVSSAAATPKPVPRAVEATETTHATGIAFPARIAPGYAPVKTGPVVTPPHVASTAAMSASTGNAAQASAAKAGVTGAAKDQKVEPPKIFVAPRPPDDPGPDADTPPPRNPADRFRTAGAKT
jgi:HemY protein